MAKLSLKPKFFKYLFRKKYEYFYILDFGRSSIKLALLEINKAEKHAKILEVYAEPHTHHIGAAEDVEHIERVAGTVKKVLEKFKNPKTGRAKELIIGLASEMVYGHSFSYIHKRENAGAKIDLRELKNAIHNAELKAYEDIRKRFVADSGYSETDVVLINSYIQEMRIDGYRVGNPLGFEGAELFVSVFNAYLPAFYKKVFEDVAVSLKLELNLLAYEPYAVFSSLRRREGEDLEAIIVDIGGKTTRISLARKGRFEEIRTFSFGGESFTKRIASHFGVGFWEAENIKIRYSKGDLSEHAKESVAEILQREFEIFLGALEMILKGFSRASLLPEKIYVHGGGGNIPLIDAIIRKRKWKRELSFLSPPKMHRLQADEFENVTVESSEMESAELISIIGLADQLLSTTTQKDTLIPKTLNRMVKLIQDQ